MLHKVLIFFICFSLILENESALAQTRMLRLTPRHALYYYAERGNIEQLTVLKQKYTLELLDNQKNTALCEGIIKNNQTAVYSLLEVGADKNAECVKKILTKNTSPLTTSKAEGLSIGTKVGIGAGIVALIGGVALAAGGGGGGGSPSSSESDNNTDNQEPDDDGSNDKDEPSTPCPYHTTSCTGGYIETGNTCNENGVIYKECQINPCHGYTSTCANGYTQQLGDICYSGDMALFKCEPNDCSGHQLSCGSGYNATESCLSGATQYYTCTPKDVPSGYTPTACREGYDTADTLISGETTYYKCTLTDCSGHQSSCGAGYNATASCLSGTTQYYTCTPKEVPSDYTATPCGNGYDEVDTFVSGETTYYKCQANRCSDFELTECPTNANCSSCQSGSVEKYQIVNCKIGYTGEKCQTFDKANYIIQDGVIYEKLTCGTNAHQFANNCVCNEGWSGENCSIADTCPYTDETGACIGLTVQPTELETIVHNSKKGVDIYGIKSSKGSIRNILHNWGETAYSSKLNIINENGKDTYGIYGISFVYNVDSGTAGYGSSEGTIDITATNSGFVYGLFSQNGTAKNTNGFGRGNIFIKSTNTGDVYGIKARTAVNGDDGIGTISITNIGDNDVYGLYSFEGRTVNGTHSSTLNIKNTGDGNVYGLYSDTSSVYNLFGTKGYKSANAIIRISNQGKGQAYGVYTKDYGYNADIAGTGLIEIINLDNGNTYGMYGSNLRNSSYTHNGDPYFGEDRYISSKITVANLNSGIAIGLYSCSSSDGCSSSNNAVYNSGNITIHNLGNGTAIGIYANGAKVQNSGVINITRSDYVDNNLTTDDTSDDITYTTSETVGGNAIGIYAASGSTVTNSGKIEINSAENAIGIWAEDNTVTVTNTGTISIDGNTSHVNAIKLNGGTLFNDGIVSATNLNFDAFGGNIVATNTSKFNVKDDLSGTLNIADTSVQKGFDTTYQLTDVIQAGNTDNLKLVSQSALFNAELSDNKHDIVMTMKSFDELTDNKSLASFLEKNYASGNNEAFFNDIKSIGNASAFTSAMDSLTGRDTIAKFTHKDLTAMREVNFAMNELMFANNDKPMFETNGSLNTFNFKNDNNSSARYALANKRISPRMKIGYAMSTTNLNTDNDDDTTRRNSVFQVFAPISYDRSGWQMIATPQIGFARGHYTRKGYNGTSYEGVIEKRIFALMNEARYPMTVGKFEVSPTVEFNAIAYNTKGSEDEKAYSLTMPSDNSLSVEAGLGIYAKRNIGNMKFNAGLIVYREFADPYNIKMGMNGMEGTFDLYEDRNEYRGVASFGFGYDIGKLNVYGNVQHFMETDTNTKFKAGLKFGF